MGLKIFLVSLIVLVLIAGGAVLFFVLKSPDVDLSTPESAVQACIDAFIAEDTAVLRKCLSEDNLRQLERDSEFFLFAWKYSIESNCGDPTVSGSEILDDSHATVSVGNCSRISAMKEGGDWKFAET